MAHWEHLVRRWVSLVLSSFHKHTFLICVARGCKTRQNSYIYSDTKNIYWIETLIDEANCQNVNEETQKAIIELKHKSMKQIVKTSVNEETQNTNAIW